MDWENNLEENLIKKEKQKNQSKIAACEQISSKKQKSMSKHLMRTKKH